MATVVHPQPLQWRGERASVTRRPRIVHVGKFYPPYRGGMESVLETLARGLTGHVDLSVLVANHAPGARHEVLDAVAVTRLRPLWSAAGATFTWGLRERLRALRPDLVHLHVPHPAAMLALLAGGIPAPLVVTWHSDIVRQRWLGAAFAPLEDAVLRRAAAILATSQTYARTSSALRRHAERVRVVPLGMDPAPFASAPAEEVAALRARFPGPLAVSIGRLVGYKGLDVLVRALVDAPGVHLAHAGTGPLRDALLAQARALGVADRFHLLGSVPDVRTLLHAGDFFVFPSVSRNEAFGMVQIEAMAAGRAVINTALATGVPDVSVHDVTGLTVPPGDAGALAAAMRTLATDVARRTRFGAAGRERAWTEFHHRTMLDRTLDVYEQVLAGAARATA